MYAKIIFPMMIIGFLVAGCQSDQKRKRIETTSEKESRAKDLKLENMVGVEEEQVEQDSRSSEFWLSKEKLETDLKAELAAAKKKPNDPKIYIRIANIAFLLQRIQLGRNACKRALKLKPGNQPALLACAKIEFSDDNLDLAELTIEKLSPKNQETAAVIELRAMIALKRGELNEAAEFYERAAKLARNNTKLDVNAGLLFLKYRQMDRAAAQFQKVLEREPRNTIAKLHLGIVHVARNEIEKAKKLLNDVTSDETLGDYARIHLGLLYEAEGDFNEALKNYAVIDAKQLSADMKSTLSRAVTKARMFRELRIKVDRKAKERENYEKHLLALAKEEEKKKAAGVKK